MIFIWINDQLSIIALKNPQFLKVEGVSLAKKQNTDMKTLTQKTKFNAKVENILGSRMQDCFLYSYQPFFFSQESLSLRQMFRAKKTQASPQKMQKPKKWPEHSTKELQMKISPRQLGFLEDLKKPSLIRPGCFLSLIAFWQSEPNINTSPSTQSPTKNTILSFEGSLIPQPAASGTEIIQYPHKNKKQSTLDPIEALAMNLPSGKITSFKIQAMPYEPWSARQRYMPVLQLLKQFIRKITQRKVAPLKVLMQYRMGRTRGPPEQEKTYRSPKR